MAFLSHLGMLLIALIVLMGSLEIRSGGGTSMLTFVGVSVKVSFLFVKAVIG